MLHWLQKPPEAYLYDRYPFILSDLLYLSWLAKYQRTEFENVIWMGLPSDTAVKALHLSARGVTTDPGSIPGCITTGRDWHAQYEAICVLYLLLYIAS